MATTVDVFGRLGREFAEHLGYEYPSGAHEYVAELLQTYRATNTVLPLAHYKDFSEPERTGLLHHVEVNVSNLERSSEFWGALLGYLGYKLYQNWPEGQSWRKADTYLVFVQTAKEHLNAGYHRKRTGLNHLALHAESREQVDEMTDRCMERGIRILYEDGILLQEGKDCGTRLTGGIPWLSICCQAEWIYDHFVDHFVYGMLAEDWRKE